MELTKLKAVYFIGVGGIGMSALARYFLTRGIKVYGYDLTRSSLTKKLEAEGIEIHYDDDPSCIPDHIDLVVYTPAIPDDHKELNWFRDNNYEIRKRAEVLGWLSQNSKTIAVAGTHGKTSTSALIAHVLKYCGSDVSAFLGGIISGLNTNFIAGQSDIVVLEADEYDRSFLHLSPEILVVTSLDADHLDIYGSREVMLEAYEQLCMQIKPGGALILMGDFTDSFSTALKVYLEINNISLSVLGKEFSYSNIMVQNERYVFDYKDADLGIDKITSVMPGEHNVSNASAAIRIASLMGIDAASLRRAMQDFTGIKRRFEWLYDKGITLIDDYAHHPTELHFAVSTAKLIYKERKVLGIFQPHLYSRTKDFYRGFADELSKLDEVWILEIYPARELPMDGVDSELIFNLIRNDNKRLIHSSEMLNQLKKEKERLDVVFTIGAADLDKYHEEMIKIFD